MSEYAPNLVVDCETGISEMVDLTAAEIAERDAAAGAVEATPVDPLLDLANQLLDAPDFAAAKKNLEAFVADRQAA